jgi:hypothetical protein
VPFIEEEDTSVQPAELAEWIFVEAEDKPEIAEHGWRVDLSDEVGLLVHPDRDDAADLLTEQVGVRSVVQLDREVLVVSARVAVCRWATRRGHAGHRRCKPEGPRPRID